MGSMTRAFAFLAMLHLAGCATTAVDATDPAVPSTLLAWETVRGTYAGSCNGTPNVMHLYGNNEVAVISERGGRVRSNAARASVRANFVNISRNENPHSDLSASYEYKDGKLEGNFSTSRTRGSCNFSKDTSYSTPNAEALAGREFSGTWRIADLRGKNEVFFTKVTDAYMTARANSHNDGDVSTWSPTVSLTDDGYVRLDAIDGTFWMLRVYDHGGPIVLRGFFRALGGWFGAISMSATKSKN